MPERIEQATDPVHGTEIAYHPFATGWDWAEPRDGEHFRRCNYCGSINPDDLVAETDWRADWADMKYGWPHKFYIDIANRDPERLFVSASTAAERRPEPFAGRDWLPVDDIPPELRDGTWLREHARWVQLAPRAKHHAKFYTAHLRDPRVSDETRDAIQRISGLRFTWTDGGVRWHRYDCTEDHPHE
jgi:hypothetical protein